MADSRQEDRLGQNRIELPDFFFFCRSAISAGSTPTKEAASVENEWSGCRLQTAGMGLMMHIIVHTLMLRADSLTLAAGSPLVSDNCDVANSESCPGRYPDTGDVDWGG